MDAPTPTPPTSVIISWQSFLFSAEIEHGLRRQSVNVYQHTELSPPKRAVQHTWRIRQAFANGLDHLIANAVSIFIIYRFKPIEIDKSAASSMPAAYCLHSMERSAIIQSVSASSAANCSFAGLSRRGAYRSFRVPMRRPPRSTGSRKTL